MWASPPAASSTIPRRLTMGSSTLPTVPDKGSGSTKARGAASVWPRPMKRARSVSRWTVPAVGASPARACTSQHDGSSGARGRRRASSAPASAAHSVWTNILEKAGWAASAAGAFSTTSA